MKSSMTAAWGKIQRSAAARRKCAADPTPALCRDWNSLQRRYAPSRGAPVLYGGRYFPQPDEDGHAAIVAFSARLPPRTQAGAHDC
jgi:hypothetical protein